MELQPQAPKTPQNFRYCKFKILKNNYFLWTILETSQRFWRREAFPARLRWRDHSPRWPASLEEIPLKKFLWWRPQPPPPILGSMKIITIILHYWNQMKNLKTKLKFVETALEAIQVNILLHDAEKKRYDIKYSSYLKLFSFYFRSIRVLSIKYVVPFVGCDN